MLTSINDFRQWMLKQILNWQEQLVEIRRDFNLPLQPCQHAVLYRMELEVQAWINEGKTLLTSLQAFQMQLN